MRVLLLSPGFAAHESDYNCIPPLQLWVKEMQVQGVDLEIITLGYPFHHQPYRWQGIPVISGYGFNRRVFRWINWLRVIRYAYQAHRKQAFDVIHSFWLGPCWLIGCFLAKHWKVPHWTTLMGQEVLKDNRYRHFLRKEDGTCLVALSAFQNDCFVQNTGIRAGHLIPWGIDPVYKETSNAPPRIIDILGCGAFIPLKNWSLWLETVAKVAQKMPTVRAWLIGEGPLRTELEAYAIRLGIVQNVQFCGHLPRIEVQQLMSSSKVLLHTSAFESFGFVLVEAQAAGCQVISTPVGVAPEMALCGETADTLSTLVLQSMQLEQSAPIKPWIFMHETATAYIGLYAQSLLI